MPPGQGMGQGDRVNAQTELPQKDPTYPFHRRMGSRAALTSSSRDTLVR